MKQISDKTALFIYFIVIPSIFGSLWVARSININTHQMLLMFYWIIGICVAIYLTIFADF